MKSKNKNNKIDHQNQRLAKKLAKTQHALRKEKTSDSIYFFTIFIFVVLTATISYGAFITGSEFGRAEKFFQNDPYIQSMAGAVSPSSEQSLDENSEVESTTQHQSVPGGGADVPAIVEYWANHYGLDSQMALKIAECESNFKNVCNSNGCEYGQGVFQFIPTSWDYFTEKMGVDYDVMNPDHNIEVAMWVLKNEGVKHWKQSVACHQFK